MSAASDVQKLLDRTNRDFDDWNDFFEHTKAVWRGFQIWVSAGNQMRATTGTGKALTEKDLAGLFQYYLTDFIGPVVLQRFIAAFEIFVFDLLRILLKNKPGKLGTKTFSLGKLFVKGDIATIVEGILDEAIDKELNEVRYKKPKEWFEYLEEVQKLGCPSSPEIEQIAEMKATRDVIEHNSGKVNRVYLVKSGGKARFKEGEFVEVDDPYLLDSWKLVKKICQDMSAAVIKTL